MTAPMNTGNILASMWMSSTFLADLIILDNPDEMARHLCEQLRELTGAKTVAYYQQADDHGNCSPRYVCPPRRAKLFSDGKLAPLCLGCHPAPLPVNPLELPEKDALRKQLEAGQIQNLLRIPIRCGTSLVASFVIADLPDLENSNEILSMMEFLGPTIGLSIQNGMARQEIQQQRDLLEEQVKIRTDELETANQELNASRSAALNMMEDAVLDKDRLYESRKNLETTLNSIGDAVISTDTDGRITIMNPVAEALTGWSKDEAHGKPLDSVFHMVKEHPLPFSDQPEDSQIIGQNENLLLVSKDGKETPISKTRAPIRNEAEDITGVVLVFRDQTEEKLALQLTQLRLELIAYSDTHSLKELLTKALDTSCELLGSAMGFYHLIDPDTDTIALQQWSTRTLNEFCKVELSQLHYNLDEAGVWADCIREKKPLLHNDFQALPHKKEMPEGHASLVREMVVPVIRNGSVVAVLGVGNKTTDYNQRDVEIADFIADTVWEIYERKQSEEALERSEAKYRMLFEQSADAYLIIKDGRFIDCNPAAVQMLGFPTKEHLLNRHPFELSPELQPDGQNSTEKANAILQHMRSEKSLRFEWMHQRANGEVFPVEVSLTAISDNEGEQVVHTVWRDITNRKIAEAKIADLARFPEENNNPVMRISSDNILLYTNPAAKPLLPSLGSKLGKPINAAWKKRIQQAIASEHTLDIEIESASRIFAVSLVPVIEHNYVNIYARDISERKRLQEAVEKRIIALTRPLEDEAEIEFEELFNLKEIQRLQDEFSNATGTAAIIIRPDGTPITEPSNFSDLCSLIRTTEKGCANCCKSDQAIGKYHPEGPIVQPCMSGGLWDAGSNITVGGKHIASWLIGQVRDETQTEESIRAYAREIGLNEATLIKAYSEVPQMSRKHFNDIAQSLFTLANQLSTTAYQNIQQARFITEQKKAQQDLRESQEHLEAMWTSMDVGILLIDAETYQIMRANPAILKMSGYDENELKGEICHRLVCPAEKDNCPVGNLNQLVDRSERKMIHADGHEIDVEKTVTSISLEGRKVYLETLVDITIRKKTERALRESEERFKSLHNASFGGIIIHDKGLILECNHGLSIMTGYSQEELIGMNGLMLIAEESQAVVTEKIKTANEEPYEANGLRKNGEKYPLRLEARNVIYKGQQVRTVEFRDITEQKKAAAELLRLSTAIEQSPETIVITDPNGTIQYANPAFETITGYTVEEALGKNPSVLKSGEHPDSFYAEMWQTISNGEIWEGHITNKRKDGTNFTEEASISPVKAADGSIVNYVAVKRDISNELVKEEELRQAQKMEAVGQLAGGVAHDFNNILQGILGFSELLQYSLDETSMAYDQATEIHNAAQRAAALTQQLLTFSRKEPVHLADIDLNNVIYDLEALLGLLLNEKHELVMDLQEDLPSIKADQSQLTQVLMNLSVNARDAMPDGGRLSISTESVMLDETDAAYVSGARVGHYLCLAVTDTGHGMDEKTKNRIFEPFFTTKDVGAGTGLGLSVIYGIVEQNNGWINVYSEIGKGTSFKIFLPVSETYGQESAPGTGSSAGSGNATILLVEDDPDISRMVVEILGNANYQIEQVSSAEEGLRLFSQKVDRFDLLLSDMELPGMRGDTLADTLRGLSADLPVLLYSGYEDHAARWKHLADRNYLFMSKPFTINILLDNIKSILKDRRR